MNIRKVTSFDDMQQLGDYITTKVYGGDEISGIAMKCVCGDIISLSSKIHTFKSYDPLDINPSILHKRDNHGQPDCHYFIKDGKYVQA